jgi:putative hydrolase of the HAD superfamily
MLLVRWMTRGKRASLLWAMFALVTLSACHTDVVVRAKVEDDGSGQIETTVILDAEAAEGLLDLGLESTGLPLTDLAQSGWLVDPPQTDAAGATIIRATKEFGTPEQFHEVMAELSGPDGVFQNFTLTRKKVFARVDYAVTGSLDTTRGFDSFADPELEAALGTTIDEIANGYGAATDDVTVSFDMTLPGDLQDAGTTGLVKARDGTTEAVWQITLADSEVIPVTVASATRLVVPRVLRGVAIVAGVMAVLIVFARLLRIARPDRRRRPPRRPLSDVRSATPTAAPTEPVAAIPAGTEYRWVAVDAMGVLFREADDVGKLLMPFARQHGSTCPDAEIISRLRWLRMGRITTGEFWSAIGVEGDADQLDAGYLAGHQLSPGVIRYLRNLRERGVKLACITDDNVTWSSRLRMRHSLETLIQVWVVSGAVGATKPDRSIFEVLRRFAQEAPAHILFIDDDLDVLDAARALGFATAWFNAEAQPSQSRGHTIIRSFEVPHHDLVESDRGS